MTERICRVPDTESKKTTNLLLDCGIPALPGRGTGGAWQATEGQPLHPQLPGVSPERRGAAVMVPRLETQVRRLKVVEKLVRGTVPHAKLCEVSQRLEPEHFTPTP